MAGKYNEVREVLGEFPKQRGNKIVAAKLTDPDGKESFDLRLAYFDENKEEWFLTQRGARISGEDAKQLADWIKQAFK